jgi:hypothetical protein
MTKRDQVAEFEASVIGRSCAISRREHDWAFDLTGGAVLMVYVPWRIISGGRIALGSNDDGQIFGRASPVDGEAEARSLLGDKSIMRAVLDRETADLTLHFEAATRIEIFNNSMGYEGWQATYDEGDKRWSVIALGGGEVAFLAE